MATPEENIANLEAALASGTMEVRIDDQTIKYASVGELKEAIRYFQAKLSPTTRPAQVRAAQGAFSRG